jgi:hypothetical protein
MKSPSTTLGLTKANTDLLNLSNLKQIVKALKGEMIAHTSSIDLKTTFGIAIPVKVG